MKSLVLYDSKFGNTKRIAESIAEVIGGHIESINTFDPEMLSEVDVVVVGSPVHAWHASTITAKFLTELEKNELKGKYVAAFDTGYESKFAGNAATRIIKGLEKAGGKTLIPTHKFIVTASEGPLGPDELANANLWAQDLKTKFEEANKLPISSLS